MYQQVVHQYQNVSYLLQIKKSHLKIKIFNIFENQFLFIVADDFILNMDNEKDIEQGEIQNILTPMKHGSKKRVCNVIVFNIIPNKFMFISKAFSI